MYFYVHFAPLPVSTLSLKHGSLVSMAREDQSGDWWGRLAPSLEEMESLTIEAMARLPEKFRSLCDNLSVHLTDFPEEALTEDLGLESPFELLGFFEGSGVNQRFSMAAVEDGHHLTLFRRAILDDWAESEETLGDIITSILIHEIGHHFGLSDTEMEEIENNLDV